MLEPHRPLWCEVEIGVVRASWVFDDATESVCTQRIFEFPVRVTVEVLAYNTSVFCLGTASSLFLTNKESPAPWQLELLPTQPDVSNSSHQERTVSCKHRIPRTERLYPVTKVLHRVQNMTCTIMHVIRHRPNSKTTRKDRRDRAEHSAQCLTNSLRKSILCSLRPLCSTLPPLC